MIRSPVSVRVTWASLPGKPVSFPPTAHTHAWGDITGKPSAYPPSSHAHAISDVTGLQAALDSKTVTWSTLIGKPAAFPPSAHTHLWADITDKPTTFAPSAHNHPWGDVTGKPATYPPASHTHLWSDITDRPTTFPPTAHTHAISDVTGLQSALDGKAAVNHTHAGLVQFIGNVTVSETSLVSLALGMKRMAITLAGIAIGDRLTFAPNGVPTAGVEAVNVYASGANQVTVSYFTPALGIGASYSIPLSVFKITS